MTNLVEMTPPVEREVIHQFKLMTGEDIIGRLEFVTALNNTETLYVISDPMVLDDWVDMKTGASGLTLNSFCPFSTSGVVELTSSKVLTHFDVHPMVRDYYLKSVDYNKKVTTDMLHKLVEATRTMETLLEPEAPINPHFHRGTGTVN